jgi:hypothetical protein
MKEVSEKNNVLFVDAFTPSQKWYADTKEDLTIDGSQLNVEGYKKLGVLLADQVFGKAAPKPEKNRQLVHDAVMEKNWMWHNDIKIPNGVHVYGRRYNPFGPDNYPAEIQKIRELTDIRDKASGWLLRKARKLDLRLLTKIRPRYLLLKPISILRKTEALTYLYGNDAL